MNCIIPISGREAVPVRAIPFVTGWELSPDIVAKALAMDQSWPDRLKGLRAHHIVNDIEIAEMLPKEWDITIRELKALSDSLVSGVCNDGGGGYLQWRKQSIPVLPSHCFVWKDEFETAALYAMNALTSMSKARPGDKELNFAPRIPRDLVNVVFEGLPIPPPTTMGDLLPFVPRVNITLDDAATILMDAHGGGREAWRNWWSALADAVDAGRIQAGTWSMDRGEQPLSHADIREWCRAGGIVWPVPLPQGRQPDIPPGDPDLVASLDQARARIAELERERAALQRKIDTTTKTAEATSINSPTLQRILEAVAQYPAWRAAQNREPILKEVLSWLQGDKKNPSREQYVAHRVIAEHFRLKS